MKIEKGKRYQIVVREYERRNKIKETFSKVVDWKIAIKVRNLIINIGHILNRNKFE